MLHGFQRPPSFSVWSIRVGGQPSFSRRMASGMSAPAMACSSWSSGAQKQRTASTSPGIRSASRRASTDVLICTGGGHAGARRGATRPSAQRRRGSPGRLFRGRLHRPLRQCHDRAAGGHAAAQRKACRGGSDIEAGKDLQRSAAGHGSLVTALPKSLSIRDVRTVSSV